MPTKEQKQKVIGELREKFKNSKVALLVNYRGLNVEAITALRRRLQETGNDLKVVKNTLTKIAAREFGLEGLDSYLQGPTAIAFGQKEPEVSAKIVTEFTRDYKQLEIKGGVLEGKIFPAKDIYKLAELPGREVLLGKCLGSLQAPLYSLVNVLQGNIRGFAYVLRAIYEQKAGERPA